MKTQIEVYLQPELEELVTEVEKKDEWTEKIKELGLEGQIGLTSNSPKDSASPYTFMNTQMKLVFETLCPTKSPVEKYNKSQIPLEVLSHIALCKQEGYFSKMEIWYDDKKPDPIAVGYLNGSYSSPLHIVARWGAEIAPYEVLLENAIARYTHGFKLACIETMNSAKQAAENAETHIKSLFAGIKDRWAIDPRFDFRLTSIDSGMPF